MAPDGKIVVLFFSYVGPGFPGNPIGNPGISERQFLGTFGDFFQMFPSFSVVY